MKKALGIILIWLGMALPMTGQHILTPIMQAQPSGGNLAPSMVQKQNNCLSSGATISSTLGSSVTSGNEIIFFLTSTTNATPSVTDTRSTVYTVSATQLNSTAGYYAYIVTGKLTSSGSDTISVSGTWNFPCYYTSEWAPGTGNTWSNVVSDTGGLNSTAASISYTQTVSHAPSLAVASSFTRIANAITAGSGWTTLTSTCSATYCNEQQAESSAGSTTVLFNTTAGTPTVSISLVIH